MNIEYKIITLSTIIILLSFSIFGCGRTGGETYMCKSDIYVVNDIDIYGCPEIFFNGKVIDRAVINNDYLKSNLKYLEGVQKIINEQKGVRMRLAFSDKVDVNYFKITGGKYRASNEVVKIEIIK